MATIKQIDGRTVHQIQSGQVIVDLCSVVKELVENSIDAGANIIEVRFKNQGLDLVEVQDNGSGISPPNYASVGLKHHTSKLSSYADIGTLLTFGFRGEALASLCALSTVVITTCLAEDAPKGTKLTFEASGDLKSTSIVASQRGTTVSVEKLFHNLPVRRRELERNIKREWHKVISLLNQYACIQTNLKFTVWQQPTKGKRIALFSTKGNATTRENIINIFGAKTMTGLVPLDLSFEIQPSSLSPALQASVDKRPISKDVRLVGHVSRPSHGEGRQTPDRQMFFVNGRPCGLPQFAKTFNEVYRSYNSSQSPFIFVNIELDTHMYDVNVSPDKRTILLHDQNRLLDTIRKSLIEVFDLQDHSVPAALLAKPGQSLAGKPAFTDGERLRVEDAGPESNISSSSSFSEGEVPPRQASGNGNAILKSTKIGLEETPRDEAPSSGAMLQAFENLAAKSDRLPVHSLPTNKSSVATDASENALFVYSPSHGLQPGHQNQLRDAQNRVAESDSSREAPVVSEAAPQTRVSPSQALASHSVMMPSIRPLKGGGLKEGVLVQRSPSRKSASRLPSRITIGHGSAPSDDAESEAESATSSQNDADDASTVKPRFGRSLSELFSVNTSTSRQAESIDSSQPVSSGDESENTAAPCRQLLKVPDAPGCGRTQERNSQNSIKESSPSYQKPANFTLDTSYESDSSEADGSQQDELALEQPAETQSVVPFSRASSYQFVSRRKVATVQTCQKIAVTEESICTRMEEWLHTAPKSHQVSHDIRQPADLAAPDAEAKLSLYISKADFSKMRVIGQFNMGFVIATRPAGRQADSSHDETYNELFIIDQHASDEKFNFERLQQKTVVQSQRLVHPKQLELTALEEEIVMENLDTIEANGFQIIVDNEGGSPVGSRCQVVALPLSRETVFNLKDLEELISLLGENSSDSAYIPRPSKVRKMFASRACRSSIMIGKALTRTQMYSLVGHMGELDKPWNCPHGRPTMRHLYRMQTWDDKGWPGDTHAISGNIWQSYARAL